jgi:hypothetical protein
MSQPALRSWARERPLGRRSLIMHTILCFGVAIARELVVLSDAERARSLSGPCCMGLVLIVATAYLDDMRRQWRENMNILVLVHWPLACVVFVH